MGEGDVAAANALWSAQLSILARMKQAQYDHVLPTRAQVSISA